MKMMRRYHNQKKIKKKKKRRRGGGKERRYPGEPTAACENNVTVYVLWRLHTRSHRTNKPRNSHPQHPVLSVYHRLPFTISGIQEKG